MINISITNRDPAMLSVLSARVETAFERRGIKVELHLFDNRNTFIHSLDSKDFWCDMAFICGNTSDTAYFGTIAKQYSDVIFVYVTDSDVIPTEAAAVVGESDFGNKIDKVVGRLILKYTEQNSLVVFKNISGKYTAPYNEIAFIESFGHNIVIHCTDQREFNVTRSLGKIEVDMAVYGFCRIHSGIIVNMKYVYAIKTNEVILRYGTCDKRLPVSRKRSVYFRERYERFLEDRAVLV